MLFLIKLKNPRPIHRNIQLSAANYFERIGNDEKDPNEIPIKKHIQEDKERLKWRKPVYENPGEWYSKFKVFAPEKDTNTHFITKLQQPIDLRPSSIGAWYKKKKERMEKHMQQFIPARHQILGNDLAAAHFIVHRGGEIKFVGDTKWTKKDENNEYTLPSVFDPKFSIEAIKCDNMILYYEGLENVRRLKNLKFLSFYNITTFDDWCLDRVSGSNFDKLEVLDLAGTKITEYGLGALYRIPTLNLLILNNIKRNKGMELVCSMLENLYPKLRIVEGNEIH